MAEILIVEDAALQQTIIRQFIQPPHTVMGFTATESEAVNLTEEHEPDIVIMDINLAEGDGIQAAKRIKATNPETNLMISTALVNDKIKEMVQNIPVDEYLIKPYSKPELLDAIENAIE